jgi:hypothetical protein
MKIRLLMLVSWCAGAAACGPSFTATTPSGFVVLEDEEAYDYRATTADGLVVAVREIDHEPRGELGFWIRALENQMREQGGYALLATRDVKSLDGVPGKKLEFGHDEGNTPHLYSIALFVTESKLFLLEAGGTRELMDAHSREVDSAIRNFRTD